MKQFFLLLAFLLLTFSSCLDSKKTQTFTDVDKKYQITTKGDWVSQSDLNDDADIQFGNDNAEKYGMVMIEQKLDFSDDFTLDDYIDIISTNMNESIENLKRDVEQEDVLIHEMKGKVFKFSGVIDSLKVSYQITFLESENDFIQIIFYCLQSKYDDKKEEFSSIRDSFTQTTKLNTK